MATTTRERDRTASSELLVELAELDDPAGVVSCYLDLSGALPGAVAQAAAAMLQQVARLTDDDGSGARLPKSRATAIRAAISAITKRPTTPGAALFVRVEDGEEFRVRLMRKVAPGIVLRRGAWLRPALLPSLADERIGVASLEPEAVRVFEVSARSIAECASARLAIDRDAWRQTHPAGAPGGTAASHGGSRVDDHARRSEAQSARFAVAQAPRIAEIAAQRRWRGVVIAGRVELAEILEHTLAPHAVQTLRTRIVVPHEAPAVGVGEIVAGEVEAIRTAIQLAATRAVVHGIHRPVAPSVVGLDDTLIAVHEARLRTLVIDPRLERSGVRLIDGSVVAADQAGQRAGVPEVGVVPDAVDWAVHRALLTGATITPVDGAAAALLGEMGGIGGLLRW